MATKEVLQEGTNVKAPASENPKGLRALLGFGAAKKAADAVAPATRRSRLDEAEKKDVGYAAGGRVKAQSPAAIKAYSKEYDTISPAGKNVHERFAGGGRVAVLEEGPVQPIRKQMGDEMDRLTGKSKVYDKQAADAKANRKEAEAEGRRFAAGGLVGTQSRGFGKARRG